MTTPFRIVLVVVLASFLTACDDKPPLAVADVDLGRFQGTWYEIAKLPRPTETGCANTTASYRLISDGKLAVESECDVNGTPRRMIAEAVVQDRSTPGKLSLDVGGFFGDYWVLEVGKDYEYAVVGHPTRDYLWILSRTPSLEPTVMSGVLDRARANQFDVARLEYTEQASAASPRRAAGPSVAPPEYGCGVANRGHSNTAAWMLVALALGSVRRKRRQSP